MIKLKTRKAVGIALVILPPAAIYALAVYVLGVQFFLVTLLVAAAIASITIGVFLHDSE